MRANEGWPMRAKVRGAHLHKTPKLLLVECARAIDVLLMEDGRQRRGVKRGALGVRAAAHLGGHPRRPGVNRVAGGKGGRGRCTEMQGDAEAR